MGETFKEFGQILQDLILYAETGIVFQKGVPVLRGAKKCTQGDLQ